jgi:hypothetical protein
MTKRTQRLLGTVLAYGLIYGLPTLLVWAVWNWLGWL